MGEAEGAITALRTEFDTLAGLVRTLDEAALRTPSGAAPWTVADVLSHLGSGAEIMQGTLEAAASGEPGPAADRSVLERIWDRWNALPPAEQADGFLAHNAVLTDFFESLTPNARDNLRIDLGFLPAPVDVATVARLRLNELALHAWDVRAAFDPAATVGRVATEQLLHANRDMLGMLAKPDRLLDRDGTVTVTTDEPASQFALHLGPAVSADFNLPATPDATVALPAEAWLRLTAGRLAPRYTPPTVTADPPAALDLLRTLFPGF